jgi:hypothetical protein
MGEKAVPGYQALARPTLRRPPTCFWCLTATVHAPVSQLFPPSPSPQVLEPNWHVLQLKMRVATSVDELMRLHAHFLDASLKVR